MVNSLALPVPSPLGSIDAYVQAVNRFPILTQDEEIQLARQLREDNDLDAAGKLVLSHLRVVVAIARGYLGYGLPHADLIQEGNIGLMKAVKRFDPDRGVRLVSFAVHWIRAEIHEFILRNWRLVKVATTKAQRKLFFNLRSLKQNLGALTSEQANDVARQLGVKREDVLEMETRLAGQDIALEPLNESDEERHSPIAYLTDGTEPSQQLEEQQNIHLQASNLKQALEGLDARSRRIIEARWLRESDPATLHDLAAEFKVSAERIRQIEQKAMQKMRSSIAVTA
jgi:RNA polymerase sigma-32 factor